MVKYLTSELVESTLHKSSRAMERCLILGLWFESLSCFRVYHENILLDRLFGSWRLDIVDESTCTKYQSTESKRAVFNVSNSVSVDFETSLGRVEKTTIQLFHCCCFLLLESNLMKSANRRSE